MLRKLSEKLRKLSNRLHSFTLGTTTSPVRRALEPGRPELRPHGPVNDLRSLRAQAAAHPGPATPGGWPINRDRQGIEHRDR